MSNLIVLPTRRTISADRARAQLICLVAELPDAAAIDLLQFVRLHFGPQVDGACQASASDSGKVIGSEKLGEPHK